MNRQSQGAARQGLPLAGLVALGLLSCGRALVMERELCSSFSRARACDAAGTSVSSRTCPAEARSEVINMAGMSSRAADLKAAVDESLNQLAQAVDEQRASDEMRRYLDLMARFHRCSWGNCLLIEMGRPGATLVAGFSRWTRLGRSVKLGEKAIHILAPCPVEVEDKNGEIQERVFFKAACVFDVSQTEGEDLATYEVPDVTVSADQLLRNLERMARRITSSFIGTNGSLASCFVRTDIPTHCPQRPEPLAADAMGRGHVLDCLGLRVLGEQKLQDHPPGSEHERGGRPHLKPLLNPDWVELGRLLARRGQRAPPSPAPPTPPHP